MVNYQGLKDIASTLIRDFGREYTGFGHGVRIKMTQSLISQGLVQDGDRLYVFTSTVVVGDLIPIDGEDWFVVGVDESKPSDIAIVYKAHVRR